MPESDRGRQVIETATGLEAIVIRRNAAGGKSRFTKRGTSAVVRCFDPESGLHFEASATELLIMACKEQGMTHDEIRDELGVDSPSSITSAMDRLTLRLYKAGWETYRVPRNRFITYAQNLGLLDGIVLDKIMKFIQDSPPSLSVAERVRRHRKRKAEGTARRNSRSEAICEEG